MPSGGLFGHVRDYNNQPLLGTYSGPNGFNWLVRQLPAASPSAGGSKLHVTFDSNHNYVFHATSGGYVPHYSFVNTTLHEDTIAQRFTFAKTSKGKTEVTVFNSLAAATNPGQFVSHTDARGVTTTVTNQSGGKIYELQRSYVISGVTTIESLLYTYFTSGSASGLLQSVQYRIKVGSGSWTPVKQAVYAYYGASNANGSMNDLQSASQQLPNGTGWNTVAVHYYRYWLAGSSTGFAHGLKMHFGPEAYRLILNAGLNPTTAADSDLLPYVDHYFEYNPTTWAVTKEISAVCPSCPGGGTTADLFAYSQNPRLPASDYNVWNTKTVQTLPDSSQLVVYSNYIAQPMLKVTIDPTGANKWATFYRYGSDGQAIWKTEPSAVALPASLSTLESFDDLLNYNPSTGLYQYLNNTAGLINVTSYDGSGDVLGTGIMQGQAGTVVQLQAVTYTSHSDSSGNTISPIATTVSYPVAGSTSTAITTRYAYSWYSGTNQMATRTTTLPSISTGQNGPGASATIVEQFDTYGNLTQRTDERGVVNQYTYNIVTSQVNEQVLNYQSGVTAPSVNVTTDFNYDNQGRLTQTLGPSHTVVLSGTATTVRPATWRVYQQSTQPTSGTWDVDQTWTGNGYATGTGPGYTYTLVDPVSISKMDKDGRSTDQITSVRSSGSGALSPTDIFNQSNWQTWSSTQYDNQHRTISNRVYFLIPSPSLGIGSVGTHFGETDYGYDALERRNRVVAPGGTITRTVWTSPQRVASIWVGTSDTDATNSDPTGGSAGAAAGNNMVIVTSNIYDNGTASNPGGSGGDGNLVQQIHYVSATSGDTRVTGFGYDFRDRKISMTDAIGRYTTYTFDNLNRLLETDQYASVTGHLIGKNQTLYDDRNRVYQQITYAVDPSTGTVGNALTSNTWYDASGNTIQQIGQGAGQVFTKSTYNGIGWVTGTYRGYNTTGTSYSQATTVANDIIASQSIPTYNEVGHIISQASYDRLNDASTSTTGALTTSNARVSYSASWFDGVDRAIATANYGAISTFTRPSTPPASSNTVLVSGTSYDSAGRVYQVTDPKGIINQTTYDAAGRSTQSVEDFGTGKLNRTTNTAYTVDNQIATLTAVNSTTGDQNTNYSYGTLASSSYVVRNDLLASVAYPDSASGSDVVSYAYNRLGQVRTITDQRGTVRTLYYDKLGRQTNDCVTTIGSGTDNAVLQIAAAYEVRGMLQTVTSYNSATQNSGMVQNQVQLSYNTFGQLITEQQDHAAAVSGSTPKVQYNYDTGASNSNEIRLNGLTYPNGRAVSYNFTNTLDAALNRITSISDSSATLASYNYTGGGMVVRLTYPQPSVWLDLWGGTSGTFNGLDQFNRVTDQRWQNNITTTPTDIDRYQYGYDQNSNRTYKANLVGTPVVTGGLDEYYSYDNLNRLTEMQRGVLNGGKTGITGTPAREMDYTLDPTGNWSAYVTKTSGTTDLSQTRTSNKVNEITAIGGTPAWATPPAYDPAGNMTSFPQPATPSSNFTATYDAWNRMTSINNSSGSVAKYQYDSRGFCIVKSTPIETRHFYFTNGWQKIEERVGTATTMDVQYIWGLRYIDELICRDDATSTPARRLYITQDATYNLTGIANSGGSPTERYRFDPYGSRVIMNASWSPLIESAHSFILGFQGLSHDLQTELINVRTRWLSPLLGRMGNRCPWGYNHRVLNLYDFADANPIRYVEPFSEPIEIGIGGYLTIVAIGGLLFGAAGCNKKNAPPAAPTPFTCGTFTVTADPTVPISDPAQQAHAGTSAAGYQVGYTPCANACPNGTITVIQVISGPDHIYSNLEYRDPHFDYPKTSVLVPGKLPPGYVDGGGLGLPQNSTFQYGFRDAPGAGDSSGKYSITDCAVCDTNGTRTVLGCTDFTYDRGSNALGNASATGKPGQDPNGKGLTWTGIVPQDYGKD